MATTQATLTTEVAEEESKYVLLDRLFLFLEQNAELNPVLSGYFCKLVSLLISRKQKQLVPYIFSAESKIMENLVKHVQQKSISEILNKLVTQIDSDFEPEIMERIRMKQQMVVTALIATLGPNETEESNLNGSSIIQDMFEVKDFYNIICKKQNIQVIADFATASMTESTKASKTCSLTVLNQILMNHVDKQKKSEAGKTEKEPNNEDEDDMIVQQNSEDEKEDVDPADPSSIAAQTNSMVEVLMGKIGKIESILGSEYAGARIQGSVSNDAFVPLGQQRLRTVELVLKMIQLKNEKLCIAIAQSKIPLEVVNLVKQYPWNNFLQLKVINIFNEVIDCSESASFRQAFLRNSGIGKALVEMSETADYTMPSERKIRNGYMGVVISVSNKLQKKYEPSSDKSEDNVVVEYLDQVGEEWRAFVDDELKKSNENNAKTLGGCTSRNNMSEEDEKEDSNYDVQMEKIMARFTNFNQILSQTSGTDDDDEDDDDDTHEDKEDAGFDEDDDDDKKKTEASEPKDDDFMKIKPVSLPVQEELKSEYSDQEFWRVPSAKAEDIDYDSLLAELEA
jgi:hypothetical protein